MPFFKPPTNALKLKIQTKPTLKDKPRYPLKSVQINGSAHKVERVKALNGPSVSVTSIVEGRLGD